MGRGRPDGDRGGWQLGSGVGREPRFSRETIVHSGPRIMFLKNNSIKNK